MTTILCYIKYIPTESLLVNAFLNHTYIYAGRGIHKHTKLIYHILIPTAMLVSYLADFQVT